MPWEVVGLKIMNDLKRKYLELYQTFQSTELQFRDIIKSSLENPEAFKYSLLIELTLLIA